MSMHYDVQAIRLGMQATFDEMIERAQPLTRTADDAVYLKAQQLFAPVTIEIAVALARAANDSVAPRIFGGAAGIMLGQALVQVRDSLGPIAFAELAAKLARVMTGELPEGAIIGEAPIVTTEGGHA
jgi:hypothetical protein